MKHRVRAAIQIVGRDDLVPGRGDVDDGVVHGGCAGREHQARGGALERGDTFLEHVVCRVHQAGVDVAQLLQTEEIGSVLGALEDVRGGAVHGHGARERLAVDGLASVKRQGFEA